MNFADIRKKFSGGDRAASADPSRAFGSEAEMMQALRKQEFTPPKPRPTAAEVMGSIRQRFTRPAEEMQDRIPRDEAAARTYAPEAMAQPEWENPFTAPEKPKKPPRDVPVYETVGGDMPFERRSAPAYIPQSYAPQQGYDPYGGYAAHGGGAFSGKDPTKVDRSAAYAARHIAKNIVAAGIADKCQVQLAYAIGVAHPVSIRVDTYGTGKYAENKICDAVESVYDLTPRGIINWLDLRKPVYKNTSAYGHFGNVIGEERTWEKTDTAEKLLEAIK